MVFYVPERPCNEVGPQSQSYLLRLNNQLTPPPLLLHQLAWWCMLGVVLLNSSESGLRNWPGVPIKKSVEENSWVPEGKAVSCAVCLLPALVFGLFRQLVSYGLLDSCMHASSGPLRFRVIGYSQRFGSPAFELEKSLCGQPTNVVMQTIDRRQFLPQLPLVPSNGPSCLW